MMMRARTVWRIGWLAVTLTAMAVGGKATLARTHNLPHKASSTPNLAARPFIPESATAVKAPSSNPLGQSALGSIAQEPTLQLRASSPSVTDAFSRELTILANPPSTVVGDVFSRELTVLANPQATLPADAFSRELTVSAGAANNPPDTQITSPATGYATASNSVAVSYTGTDDNTDVTALAFYIRVDGGAWMGPYTGPGTQSVSLAPGSNLIEAKAVDGSGQEDPTPASIAVTSDSVAPVLSQLIVTEVGASNATLVWLTDEPSTSSIKYRVVGSGSWLDAGANPTLVTNHTFKLQGLTSGTDYEAEASSSDAAGNLGSSDIVQFQTTSDGTPPHTSLDIAPKNGGAVQLGPVAFGWSGTDDVTPPSLLRFQYCLDGGAWTPGSPTHDRSVTLSITTLGSHTFAVRAVDQSDNVDPNPPQTTFTIDASAPTIGAPTVTNIRFNATTVSWSTSEPTTGVVQWADSASGQFVFSATSADLSTSHSIDIGGLAPKTTYRLRVIASDSAGNQGTSPEVSFTTLPMGDLEVDASSLSAQTDSTSGLTTLQGKVWNRGDVDMTATAVMVDAPDGGTPQEIGRQSVTLAAHAVNPALVSSTPTTLATGTHRLTISLTDFSLPDAVSSDDSATLNLPVGGPAYEFTIGASDMPTWPGNDGLLTVWVTNTGSSSQSLASLAISGVGWATLTSPLPADPIQPGASFAATFRVQTPADAPSGAAPNPVAVPAVITATGQSTSQQPLSFLVYSQPLARINVKVTSASTGDPVSGATVSSTSTVSDLTTDATGQVIGPDGAPGIPVADVPILSVAAPGYLSQTLQAPLTNPTVTVPLATGNELQILDFTVTPLTQDEITARGINLADPVNYWVFDFTLYIQLGDNDPQAANVSSFTLPVAGSNVPPATGGGEIHTPAGTFRFSIVGTGSQVGCIVIPGQVKMLKQFWDASYCTKNTSSYPIVGAVTGLIPPGGISLPNLNGKLQPSYQALGGISPGEQVGASWTVRGDEAGTYKLTGTATGSLQSGQTYTPVSTSLQSAPFDVVAPEIKLTADVPDAVQAGTPFDVTFHVQNICSITLQDVSVWIDASKLVNCTLADAQEKAVGSIAPGATSSVTFTFISKVTGRVVNHWIVLSGPRCSPSVGVTPTSPPLIKISNADFGLVPATDNPNAKPAVTTITVANVGSPGSLLTGSVNPLPSPFALVGDGSFSLAAGQTKSFTVIFQPRVGDGGTGFFDPSCDPQHVTYILKNCTASSDAENKDGNNFYARGQTVPPQVVNFAVRGATRDQERKIEGTSKAHYDKSTVIAIMNWQPSTGYLDDLGNVKVYEDLTRDVRSGFFFTPSTPSGINWASPWFGNGQNPLLLSTPGVALGLDGHPPVKPAFYPYLIVPDELWFDQAYEYTAPWLKDETDQPCFHPLGHFSIGRIIFSKDVFPNPLRLADWWESVSVTNKDTGAAVGFHAGDLVHMTFP